jgi:hypothetical protein
VTLARKEMITPNVVALPHQWYGQGKASMDVIQLGEKDKAQQ